MAASWGDIYEELQSKYVKASWCHLFNIALGEQTKTVTVSNRPNYTANRVVSEAHQGVASAEVPMMRLDEFCFTNRVPYIDYLKIDTEGLDLEVVKGAGDFLRNIDFVECEVSANEYNRYHVPFFEVYQYMTGKGFQVFHFYELAMEPHNGGYPVLRRFNAVFINGRIVGRLQSTYTSSITV